MTVLSFRDRCQNLIRAKCATADAAAVKHVDAHADPLRPTEEPDREESPEPSRNGTVLDSLSFGGFERRGTASWPSAAIDFNALTAVPAALANSAGNRVSSFESESHYRAACESFDSTVTDFDFLTSPGAQAELNAEYVDAVKSVKSALPQAGTVGDAPTLAAAPLPAFDMTSVVGSGNSTCALHAQAAELEFMAAQIMAQAYQAKAQALRAQSGLEQDASNVQVPSSPPQQQMQPCKDKSKSTKSDAFTKPVDSDRTTVMLRNLPNDYNRDMLIQLLNEQGFQACFDFLYLPMDLKRRAGLGYAFVNMVTPLEAQRMFSTLQGFSHWQGICSAKVLEVCWGDPLQGLEAHVNRYRNSPVMHEDAPAEFRPLLFRNGQQVEFPPPTRKLRAPRLDFRSQ